MGLDQVGELWSCYMPQKKTSNFFDLPEAFRRLISFLHFGSFSSS